MEGILIHDQNHWRKETNKIYWGNNYHVSKQNLIHALLSVFKQKRLNIDMQLPLSDKLNQALTYYNSNKNDKYPFRLINKDDDIVFALSLPVWYYENYLSIKNN